MQKEIIEKINFLVEMSDTNNHYEPLKEELNVLESEITSQKNEISRLQKSMERNKYLNSSDRIIDENIKIGLENKLDGYEKSLNEILSEIEKVSQEEEEYHQMILELENEIETSKRFLDSLELKIKTIGSKDKSVYTFYEGLIDSTTKEIKANETRLHVKRKAYEQIANRLQSYGESRFDLEEKMQKDSLKLEETKAFLEAPDTYVDVAAKKRDEQTLEEFEENLEKLEKRRLEIITDPAYIGHDAIDLLISDDRTSALAKVKELVTIVNAKPYMDFRYEELDEILEDAKERRDEFSNTIDTKKYDGSDATFLESRMQYLERQIEAKEKEKEELNNKIRKMDIDEVQELMQLITNAKEMKEKLKVEIDEYKKVMDENNDYKSPKKKASLNAAFHHKCEELEQVEEVIASYEKDLEKTVEISKELEEKALSFLTDELKAMKDEISHIKKKKMYETSTTDILAVEKDKSELKKLSDEVLKIEHRKKYQTTPNEIYDEIEITLSSLDGKEEEIKKEEEPVNLKDYRIDLEDAQENQEEEKKEDFSIEPIFEDDKLMEEKEVLKEENTTEPILEEEKEEIPKEEPSETEHSEEIIYPPRNQAENTHLYKVIKVEPLEEESEETKEENEPKVDIPEPVSVDDDPLKEDYIMNDFDDTDYISFNDLLEGSMNDGN